MSSYLLPFILYGIFVSTFDLDISVRKNYINLREEYRKIKIFKSSKINLKDLGHYKTLTPLGKKIRKETVEEIKKEDKNKCSY
ncbi:MAG: hypothetical protein KDK36_20550 [Leptospiraceae bacterium]|nr:hypothetical protein [Leptospiraceae bacterium]